MKHEIVLTDTAREHYRGLDARGRSSIKKGLKDHLAFEPTKLSRSRMICLFPAQLRKWNNRYKTLIPFYQRQLMSYRFEARIVGIFLFGIPSAMGVWLRSLGVRVLATLAHPVQGLKALPENWRRILWAMDSRHAPELVPGLAAEDGRFSPSRLVKRIRAVDWPKRLRLSPLILIWFLPGLLYRWSLKSTCWLYLPLLYLGGGLGRSRTPEEEAKEKGLFVTGLYKGRVEGLRRWLALGVLASAIITTALNHPALGAGIRGALDRFPLLLQSFLWGFDRLTEHAANLTYLWAFNLNGWDLAPWQWLNLLGAVLTGALYFYSDRVNRAWTLAKEPNPNAPPEAGHVARLLRLTRARNLCVFFYVPLALGYAVLALGGLGGFGKGDLTGWLGWLGGLYGPYL
uniref:Uncharacterized protein n=1 Tax=Candidatus Kentrum eta TaxID=2126337 RepID=A0A450V335_9GAMM|nr:MAG: hypothetical protein BECKH772A_GA0070896_100309 [Candidatus Kentron sp. H]VFJ99183.1 MAG: hypothetical protein BECKH772C_GA0070978_1002923 [Candidatus Kentron sp. H]VFK00560.1 MAG: hypothetical protein BECKH772B_GA0070898_101951 [Candidatus Kentron sp. H]